MIQGTPTRIIALLQAIQNGHTTTSDIMAATGMGRNGISELGRLLAADGLITREFIKPDQRPDTVLSHAAGRTSVVFGLTEKGMACIDGLAETPSYNLYIIKTADSTNEHSIKHFCNQPDYRQWLQSMKRLARQNRNYAPTG
jgi:hypothetical protein